MRAPKLAIVLSFGLLGIAAACASNEVPAADVAEAVRDITIATDANETTAGAEQASEPASWQTDPARTPVRLHATWQHDPAATLTFQWQTDDKDVATYVPRVWYARDDEVTGEPDRPMMPLTEGHLAEGTGVSYSTVWEKSKVFVTWTVEVTGLEPDTAYAYRVGTWDALDAGTATFTRPDLSPMYHVRTGHPKGSRDPFRFVMAGDSRGGYEGIATNIERLRDLRADAWFFNGDFNDLGSDDDWASWFQAMAPLLVGTVLMPVPGNHEALIVEQYYQQFALPVEPTLPPEKAEHAWSVDYGNTHFVGLNSISDAEVQALAPWLEANLAAAAADPAIDWRIVMYHHPAYSACTNHGANLRVQAYWAPLFEKYGVDVTFAGHDHNYERTWPIRDGQVVEDGQGVVHVVAGAFFADPYTNGTDWWTATSAPGDKANYAVIEADGKRLEVTAYSGDGTEVLDQFSLVKP